MNLSVSKYTFEVCACNKQFGGDCNKNLVEVCWLMWFQSWFSVEDKRIMSFLLEKLGQWSHSSCLFSYDFNYFEGAKL